MKTAAFPTHHGLLAALFVVNAWAACLFQPATAQDAPTQPVAEAAEPVAEEAEEPEPLRLPPPKQAKALPEPDQVWVDKKRGQVMVDGYIALREGYLEMFACIAGTKEHESIVAIRSRAKVVHAALLSVGAVPGSPVEFMPEFKPPTGDEIEIEVRWLDEDGKPRSARGQEWVVDAETKKQLDVPWVFAGSGFWTDEESGERFYMAEGGDVVCVSNFATATLDVPMPSSSANEGLLFEAKPDGIPPLGTPVRLVLTVKKGKPVDGAQQSQP
ncbi:MAG: YdjY domain-containing protein [Planctomycetota bacterium]